MDSTDGANQPKEKVKGKYVARSAVDMQRIKVDKLMENPVSATFAFALI